MDTLQSTDTVFTLYTTYFTDIVYNKLYQLAYNAYNKHQTKEDDMVDIYKELCVQFSYEINEKAPKRMVTRSELYTYVKEKACFNLTLDKFLYNIASHLVPPKHMASLTEDGVDSLFNKCFITFVNSFINKIVTNEQLMNEIIYDREEKNTITIKTLQIMGCNILKGFKKLVVSKFTEREDEIETVEVNKRIDDIEARLTKIENTNKLTKENLDIFNKESALDATIVEHNNQKKEISELKDQLNLAILTQNKQSQEILNLTAIIQSRYEQPKQKLSIKKNSNAPLVY